jgi:hypothetical protein
MEDDEHSDDIRHVLVERCDSFDPSVPTRCVEQRGYTSAMNQGPNYRT